MTWELHRADARAMPIPDGSVDLIVTSPPYWGLRSYRDQGEHYAGQVGSEDTPQQFVDELVGMIDSEWRRVLKPSGSLWLNLGDKYAGSQPGNNNGTGSSTLVGTPSVRDRSAASSGRFVSFDARPKSLLGLPWRVALALIDRGWILRAEVIWSKPNGLPESVTDRVRRSHEQWFHLTLEPRYFSAVDEIREPHADPMQGVGRKDLFGEWQKRAPNPDRNDGGMFQGGFHALGRLPGSVWEIPTEPLIIPDEARERLGLTDHFAAFPQEWPRRIISGWSPERGVVLDPFCGTGTTVGVADILGRHGIGVDLSADYIRLAEWRITESGHFTKTEKRMWEDRQETLL